MSETPRTDTLLIAWDFTPEPRLITEHARELERELNAANARVKELKDENAKLKAWIADLAEIERHTGKTDDREWKGHAIGCLYKGQVVYIGEEKP